MPRCPARSRRWHSPSGSWGPLPAASVSALPALADTISIMNDFRSMAQDPEHRRRFEKLLYLATQRGDADLVAERLSWGTDPNCTYSRGRTPLIANLRGSCPSAP